VIVIGGALDRRAMVTLGAQTLDAFGRFTADICFLGLWSIHAEHGISNGYYEEAEVERVMVERADRVVGLASREKLGTVAPFTVGPATKLTHLATEPDIAPEIVRPFAELGIHLVQGHAV
jgi:DeoR/GlpR family transcriptional regulator of sugar metabolism